MESEQSNVGRYVMSYLFLIITLVSGQADVFAVVRYLLLFFFIQYDAMELPGQQLPATNAYTALDHLLNLDIKAPPGCQRLTAIIASMGITTFS